jgi:hypothetical protein
LATREFGCGRNGRWRPVWCNPRRNLLRAGVRPCHPIGTRGGNHSRISRRYVVASRSLVDATTHVSSKWPSLGRSANCSRVIRLGVRPWDRDPHIHRHASLLRDCWSRYCSPESLRRSRRRHGIRMRASPNDYMLHPDSTETAAGGVRSNGARTRLSESTAIRSGPDDNRGAGGCSHCAIVGRESDTPDGRTP